MSTRESTDAQKFASGIIWIAVSQILVSAIGIIVLPVLTKSYTPAIYGVWVQINVTIGICASLMTLYLGAALIRFVAGEGEKEQRRQTFGTMLWTVFFFTIIVFIFSIIFRQDLSLLIFSSDQFIVFVPLTFLWASLEALFAFLINYFQAMGNIKKLTIIQVASSSIKIGLITVLATTGYSLIWIVISIIIAQTLFVTIICMMIIKDLGFPKLQFNGLKRFLAFSLPYIPSGITFFIISSSDKYFIAHLLNLSEAGIYAASYSIGSIILFFSGPISFVLYPKLIKLWEQKETMRLRTYLEYSIKLFLALAIPGSVGLYILSQPLLGLLATSEYAVGGILVLLIALGTTMYGIYQITVCIICLAEQTKWLPLAIALSAATNICINLALIPKVGIIVAAFSMAIAYLLLAIIVAAWAGKIFNYSIDLKFIAKIVLATILMAFCLSFIKIGGALSIALTTITGLIIFGAGLFFLRAFSRDDLVLIREILSGINIKLWVK